MRYSLISRFRGALLGALLGETLAKGDEQKSQSGFNMGQALFLSAESLIALGRLDVDYCLERQQQQFLHLNTTDNVLLKVIFASIPVALYFHENTIKLRQNLLRVVEIWEDDPIIQDGTLAVGYAIAQSLTEKLEPRTLIPQIISFIGETPTSLPQQLLTVNDLLNRACGLGIAQAELSRENKHSHSIAMAFYCFLSTLEDFRLSVLRATHNGDLWHSQTTGAITGALSGVYNSTVGIPVKWQVLLSPTTPASCGLTNFSQMLELADALATVWSGVYNLNPNARKLLEEEYIMSEPQAALPVYAAPRVIRSR
jgi:ADP-ribosylglycohydrolase